MEPKHAKVLTPAKFRHLLRVTEATSRFPERDTLILLLGVTCGMRITEIARIEVGDVLAKSGVRREEVSLRGLIRTVIRQMKAGHSSGIAQCVHCHRNMDE